MYSHEILEHNTLGNGICISTDSNLVSFNIHLWHCRNCPFRQSQHFLNRAHHDVSCKEHMNKDTKGPHWVE